MTRSNVIRVDWPAWAAADAMSRRACGPKAFVMGGTHVHLPPPPEDDFDRAAARKTPERVPPPPRGMSVDAQAVVEKRLREIDDKARKRRRARKPRVRVEEPAPVVDAWADSVDAWRTKNMGRKGVTC